MVRCIPAIRTRVPEAIQDYAEEYIYYPIFSIPDPLCPCLLDESADRFLLYFKRSAKEIPSVSEFVSVLATHIRYSLAELDSPLRLIG